MLQCEKDNTVNYSIHCDGCKCKIIIEPCEIYKGDKNYHIVYNGYYHLENYLYNIFCKKCYNIRNIII